MAEGGRIEPGPWETAGRFIDLAEFASDPAAAAAVPPRARWAADLLETGAGFAVVRLAGGDTCLCHECLWLRSVLALLREMSA